MTLYAARDCLDWLIKKRRENGAYWQRRITKSESPLLRALAVHSIRIDESMPSDQKVAWLLATNPLLEVKRINDRAPYIELYALAEEIYPRLNEERRGAMIEAIAENQDVREQCEWYHRLLRSDPECLLAKAAFNEAQSRRPEWKPMNDFGKKVAGDKPKPVSADQLLERHGSGWIPKLIDLFNQSSGDLTTAVTKAARQNFDWSLELADALAEAGEWETGVWKVLICAWRFDQESDEENLSKDQFRKVLVLLDDQNLHGKDERDYYIIWTLRSLISAPYAIELLPEANRIAASFWDKIDDHDAERPATNSIDGCTAAHLASYWLDGLQLLRKDPSSAPKSIEGDWAEALSKIALDPSPKGRAGRSALAQRFACLFNVDKRWTEKNLLPYFSSPNDEEFLEIWQGFLTRWHPGKEQNLTDETAKILYRPSYKAVKRILPDNKLRKLFVDIYTEMVIFVVKNPMKRWLPEFFKRSSKENRHDFMDRLGWYLLRYENDEAKVCELWEHWLKSFWGKPPLWRSKAA